MKKRLRIICTGHAPRGQTIDKPARCRLCVFRGSLEAACMHPGPSRHPIAMHLSGSLPVPHRRFGWRCCAPNERDLCTYLPATRLFRCWRLICFCVSLLVKTGGVHSCVVTLAVVSPPSAPGFGAGVELHHRARRRRRRRPRRRRDSPLARSKSPLVCIRFARRPPRLKNTFARIYINGWARFLLRFVCLCAAFLHYFFHAGTLGARATKTSS